MSPPQTFFVVLVLIINYLSVIGQPGPLGLYCSSAYQCVGNQLVESIWIYIYGSGYKSISGMNTFITSEGHVECSGAFACTETLFIIGYSIICTGAGSCANIIHPSQIHEQSFVACHGANACQNSNIISNGTVYCSGDQSCSHSNITSPTVYAEGAYSLYGST
eukprot:506501_1